ncbi:MAG: aminotransferase class III-fold pyridoxal phosphate-dependent enzyme, partial [Bacteroidota bacterium]
VFDKNGKQYLDFYGGHAVISIGHQHPHYVKKLKSQISKIGFYSNAVQNELQFKLANKITELSGLHEYQIFYSNSGAESIENALKIASLETGKSKVICFENSFHGRTSGAASVTDMTKGHFPLFKSMTHSRIKINDKLALAKAISSNEHCAVILEPIQAWAGVYEMDPGFLQFTAELCKANNVKLIVDEVQCGFGRTGSFFAFQNAKIVPDIICTAKGMGNGFPVAATLFHSSIKPIKGTLGTTFGGNHLAMAASIAVCEVIQKEKLIENALHVGQYLKMLLQDLPYVKSVRGSGLLIGVEFEFEIKGLVKHLLHEHQIFCGTALNNKTLRILPPLNISNLEADIFINKLKMAIQEIPSLTFAQ